MSQWNTNLSLNTPVSIAANDQQNVRIAEDGNGGALVVWEDYSNNASSADIYIQRFNKNGIAKWAPNGLALCNLPSHQSNPNINYRNGKVVVIWNDSRNGNTDIYAQMLDTSGNVLWTNNGVPVVTNSFTQNDGKVALTASGESFVVYQDSSAGNWNIMAQKLSASGTRMWSNTGTVVCNAGYDQKNPRLELTSDGGIYVVWQDKRNGANNDIYCQKINANGVRLWNPAGNGYWVCSAAGTQTNPKIETFGAGFIVAWQDNRNTIDYDIYAQYINDNGMAQWNSNGIPVCTAGGNQSAHDLQANASLAFLVWKDGRSGTNTDIYYQVITTSGSMLMVNNGAPLATSSFDQINPNIDVDAAGNAYVVWQDSTALGWNIYGAKINVAGQVIWNVPVSTAPDTQADPKNIHDESGGMIVAWQDKRNFPSTARDIYIQKIFSNGSPDNIHEWIKQHAGIKIIPSHNGQIFNLSVNADFLPAHIEIMDVAGKKVFTEPIHSESKTITPELPSGVYVIKINANKNYTFVSKWITP
jgi:hypothetical protein